MINAIVLILNSSFFRRSTKFRDDASHQRDDDGSLLYDLVEMSMENNLQGCDPSIFELEAIIIIHIPSLISF